MFKNVLIFIGFAPLFLFSQEKEGITSLKDKLKTIEKNSERASLLLNLSEQYLNEEVFDSVIFYAKEVTNTTSKKEQITSANVLQGRANVALGNYEQGKDILIKTIDYFANTNDERLPQVYLSIGNAYMSLNILDEALVNFKLAEKLMSEEDKARVYIYFSTFYSNTHQYEKALDYLNKVVALATKFGDKPRLAGAYAYFAKLNSDRYEHNEALKYYNLAIDLYKQLNSEYNIAAIENNIGGCYFQLKNYDAAKKHYDIALDYCDKNNYLQLNTIIKSNIAQQNISQDNNIDESIKELNAINNAESPDEVKGLICQNYHSLALAHLKKKDTLTAMKALDKAIEIADSYGFSWDNETNLSLLSSLNYKRKEYAEAYLNAQKVIKYKEEIYNQNKNKEIELLRTRFDVNQKENEIKLKEQKLSLINERTKKNRYLYFSIGLVLMFIIISLFRQNKLVKIKKKVLLAENDILNLKEEQLKKEIESKSYHVTNLALDIADKNKFLETLKNQIKKVRRKINSKTLDVELQNTVININDYIKRNEDKLQITLEVDKNNKAFYDRLKIKYPDLTDRDIKIIGYLRLNMSSQQISNTLNITELSINNVRSKIRKKLEINKNETFTAFLKNI